jgi:GNAT superfamily N-acetyltransferase
MSVHILPWLPDRAGEFRDINLEWIESMFVVEEMDRAQLETAQATIIDSGGTILFAGLDDGRIVGTGALMAAGNGAYEVAKMGVRPAVQGHGAGQVLDALIAEARVRNASSLFLLTNARCEAAVRLYERSGFVHDAAIMARYGSEYERCDVAMSYPL